MSATVERFGQLVAGQNQEIRLQAGIQMATGALYSLAVGGAIWLTIWVPAVFTCIDFRQASHWAWGVVLVFAGVATFEAWRQVEPFAALEPLTEWQRALTAFSQATPGFVYFSPRHASAGIAFLLLAGPESLFSATKLWRSQLPADPEAQANALGLLQDLQRPSLASQVPPEAATTLHRLGLIKILPGEGRSLDGFDSIVAITEKGQSLLDMDHSGD